MAPCIRVKITDIRMVDEGGIFVPQAHKFLPDYAVSHQNTRLHT